MELQYRKDEKHCEQPYLNVKQQSVQHLLFNLLV